MASTSRSPPVSNDGLWRDCVEWFIQLGVIRYSNRANWPGSDVSEFANILRDGVLLCQLLNQIDPGCIDMKNVILKPTMAQFLCLRNIRLFLKKCKHFDLKSTDLFEETMLFDLTHFHKVLCTLSTLSRSPKARKTGVVGFTAHTEETPEEDDIYQGLRTHHPSNTNNSLLDSFGGENAEEIYQDLLAVRGTIKRTKSKRDCVINEIIETEKNYVGVLSKLMMSFMLPLQQHMSTEENECVFHKIKELYNVHSPFMVELTKVRTNSDVKLSEIFLRFKGDFLIYGSYGANLTRATALLQELCDQDRTFNNLVVSCELEADNGKFKLKDILIVPVQRMLKYHLLLDSLVKETEQTHPEYIDLSRAKEAMLDVSNYINEEVRDSERLDVINNLQNTIDEWRYEPNKSFSLSSYGKIIKEAEVKIRDPADRKTRSRYVFVFDKCLLMCAQIRRSRFSYCGILNLYEYHIEEVSARSFSLKCDETEYLITTQTEELNREIIEAIKQGQDNNQPTTLSQTNHQFKLHTFTEPVICSYCDKYLKGLIFQGYICTECDTCVHKDCIQSCARCSPRSIPSTSASPGINESDLLVEKLWFVGEMTRNTAEKKLRHREVGTFLVRIGNNSNYVISLRTSDFEAPVRHIRIINRADKYSVGSSRYFNRVEELVLYYEVYSLQEEFESLDEDTKLLYPFHQLKAVVLENCDAADRYQLSLRKGQMILVIGKDGYRHGYWKGRTEHNEIGYFLVHIIRIEGTVEFERRRPGVDM